MASVARAIEQAASSITLDESLWWDSHESLFHDLDGFLCGTRKLSPAELVQKLKKNYSWLKGTLSCFKGPNPKSKSAVDGGRIVLGSHILELTPERKKIAMELSTQLGLDEVQAYLLVEKFCSDRNLSSDPSVLQKLTMKYYMERQCVLKCTRLLLLTHLAESTDGSRAEVLENEAKKLANDGLENEVFMVMHKLLRIEQPLHLDLDLMKLWAEEIVMETSLIMDILFLIYYEPLCSCTFSRWSELFALFQERVFSGTNLGRLSLTGEAVCFIQHIRHQAVLIILETLDLDKLLLLVFNEVPLSEGKHAFSVKEVQQIDGLFAGLKVFDAQENAPLLLGWATFGSLVCFLPVGSGETKLMETDNSATMQQAYEGGAFKYLLNMLRHKGIKESIIDGYKSVVKSLLSSLLAAYDMANQGDATSLDVLVDILYEIYVGQEFLCVEFWDRDCVLDGPIRNLVFSLRDYFPYRLQPLVRLLAGLAEGSWPSECVYHFLYKMGETTCLYHHSADDGEVVTTTEHLRVPGVPGLIIPAGSDGQILKVLDNETCVVRWKCKHSAIIVIILHLMDASNASDTCIEAHASVEVLHRMLMGNKMLAEFLLQLDGSEACTGTRADGRMEGDARINVLATICSLLEKIIGVTGKESMAALCMDILCMFTHCCPSKVMLELSKITPVQTQRGATNYLEEGLLVKILSKISLGLEQAQESHVLLLGAADLCTIMVEKGMESEALDNMVVYIVGTSFVNHMSWGYSQTCKCWKMTTKIFELACKVLSVTRAKTSQLWIRVFELVIVDGSFHDVILKILSTTSDDLEELNFTRHTSLDEIEWFQKALCSGMSLLNLALQRHPNSFTSQDRDVNSPLEHALLHHAVGAMPFVGCVGSVIGFWQNQKLQLASIKLLMALCLVARQVKPHPVSISSYFQDAQQKRSFRAAIGRLFGEDPSYVHLELFDSAVELVQIAARYQPSLIELIFSSEVEGEAEASSELVRQYKIQSDKVVDPTESICKILKHAGSLFESQPHILSGILALLKSIWEGCAELSGILEAFCHSHGFWTNLRACLLKNVFKSDMNADQLLVKSFQYQCQTAALQIMTIQTFLVQFKILHESRSPASRNGGTNALLKNGDKNILDKELPLEQWGKSVHPSQILVSYVQAHYERSAILRAKAEMRALLVALILRILVNDDHGFSAQLIKYLKEALKAVSEHPSFQTILSTYLSHGYGRKEPQVLVMNDLYFHLQGELEAGRHIPSGSFENLVEFLDTFDLMSNLNHGDNVHLNGLEPQSNCSPIYDTTSLRQHLGIEWLSNTGSLAFSAAESTLEAMQYANGMACLAASQLDALRSLTNLLALSGSNKQMVCAVPVVKALWTNSCLEKLCEAMEHSIQLLGPNGDPTEYMPKFLATQSQLLLILVQWFSKHSLDDVAREQAGKVCCRVVATIVRSMKSMFGSVQAVMKSPKLLVRSLIGAYLICLEFMLFLNKEKLLRRPKMEQNDEDAFVSTALLGMESLPLICSIVEVKEYANLAIAAISLLIKDFLSHSTWLPILQTHFPVRVAVSLLRMTEDMDTSYQLLQLFLSLSHSQGGINILLSVSFLSHILVFSEQLKADGAIEMEGPFRVSKWKTKKNELWSLCVAIIAVAARTVTEKNGGSIIVEDALVFFESQKTQMMCTLQSPCLPDMDAKKRAKLQRPQTSIAALQQTQQVLHLLLELTHHSGQWSAALERSEMDFTENCIHLLAYIAREGLVRNINSSHRMCVLCPANPTKAEEVVNHSKASMIGCTTGWFAITARGAASATQQTLGSPGLLSVLPSQYSDLVALNVYTVALLMLDFVCKQAQRAVKTLDEGRALGVSIWPKFPAPEILYGLQDQATAVVTEVCRKRTAMSLDDDASKACCTLLSIMEKAVFLELCVSRICGIGPQSMRSEDFSKDFKALLSAVQGHHFLEAPIKALKGIAELAYPALF